MVINIIEVEDQNFKDCLLIDFKTGLDNNLAGDEIEYSYLSSLWVNDCIICVAKPVCRYHNSIINLITFDKTGLIHDHGLISFDDYDSIDAFVHGSDVGQAIKIGMLLKGKLFIRGDLVYE